MHKYQDLIKIFNDCFLGTYQTQLVLGGDEPLYLPAHDNEPYHSLYFAHGFYSSALHECAHWLIAGPKRRTLEDFGYWYVPDGRTETEQALFQACEVKPQALEWILSVATGYRFRVSIDNLNGSVVHTDAFKEAIHQQVIHYCRYGLGKRAAQLRQALCIFYGTRLDLNEHDFCLTDL